MNRFTVTVMGETLQGTGSIIPLLFQTSDRFNATLGLFDQLAVDLVISNVIVPGGTTIAAGMDLLHSADGIHFNTKGALGSGSVGVNSTHIIGFDDGTVPTLGFARVQLALTFSAAAVFSMKVMIRVTCNDTNERDFAREILKARLKSCTQVVDGSWRRWLPPHLQWLLKPPWNASHSVASHSVDQAAFDAVSKLGGVRVPFVPQLGDPGGHLRIPCEYYEEVARYRAKHDPNMPLGEKAAILGRAWADKYVAGLEARAQARCDARAQRIMCAWIAKPGGAHKGPPPSFPEFRCRPSVDVTKLANNCVKR